MKEKVKNIVVTGGAGFIGSHLIDVLLKEGHNVTNVDNFDPFYDESIKRENIKGHLEYDSYTLHEVDIRDKKTLDKAIPNDTDVIVHLAAKAGVRPSIADPIAYQEVNVAGTQNMLEVAREKDIKQFLFASSSSVYGKNPNVPWKEDAEIEKVSGILAKKIIVMDQPSYVKQKGSDIDQTAELLDYTSNFSIKKRSLNFSTW